MMPVWSGLSADEYRQALAALAPQGLAWSTDIDSHFQRLLAAWASSMARLDGDALALIAELNPASASEQGLLFDWLRITDTDSQAELIGTFAAVGGASPAYFIQLAAALGITVTIEEFQPFTCISACIDSVGELWPFAFGVRVHGATDIDYFDCTSPCNGSLAAWGIEALERLIQRLKPAHTRAIFFYGS